MRLYGLIGYPLTHSFSKKYFEEKFARENITNVVFENFSIEYISMLSEIIQKNISVLQGLAVTIPYKKRVIDFLDEADDVVKQINACNCIVFKEGRLKGYNTDVIGFEKSFVELLQPHHKKALILGTGGAAAAVAFVMRELSIEYKFVSRSKGENTVSYNDVDEEMMQAYPVIINTTPLGTTPNVQECPPIFYEALTGNHYLFDLIYNPLQTKFLYLGKKQGAVTKNGYDMLAFQAEENWKIWNGLS
ncbi:MAG: shikimate dehydrogenase [Sphingobacteriia bacterium]|nr:shikimate dehydrogenase [Sphingobacteriia bacterium]